MQTMVNDSNKQYINSKNTLQQIWYTQSASICIDSNCLLQGRSHFFDGRNLEPAFQQYRQTLEKCSSPKHGVDDPHHDVHQNQQRNMGKEGKPWGPTCQDAPPWVLLGFSESSWPLSPSWKWKTQVSWKMRTSLPKMCLFHFHGCWRKN